jgi:hypothetical protein
VSSVEQRSRIARVRRVQHDLAMLAAAKAAGHVQLLESNEHRLSQMGKALAAGPGLTSGAVMAARGELKMRLEGARDGLARTIVGARQAAALREKTRLGARRDQEGAEKLERQAAKAAALAQDRRIGAAARQGNKSVKGDEE